MNTPPAHALAARAPVPLHLQPVEAALHGWPMRYQIAVGVRRSDAQLLRRVMPP